MAQGIVFDLEKRRQNAAFYEGVILTIEGQFQIDKSISSLLLRGMTCMFHHFIKGHLLDGRGS